MIGLKVVQNTANKLNHRKTTRCARVFRCLKGYVQSGIQMELRFDNFVWILACTLCTVATSLFFVSALVDFYFAFGRYVVYLAFIVGLVAIALVWYRSIKVKGWRNHLIALAKTAVFSAALVVLIISHSGI